MRSITVALFALLVTSTASPAQEPRFALVLTHGKSATTAIYDHVVDHTGMPAGISSREHRRLSIGDGAMTAIRVAYRMTGAWRLSAEVARGSADFDYVERIDGSDVPAIGSLTQARGPARRRAYSVAVARRWALFGTSLFVEPEAGATLHRLTVGATLPVCPVVPPSLGFPPNDGSCVYSREQWERTYSAPSVTTGLALGFRISRRTSAQVRGQYSVGRVSTEEGFWVDYVPQMDYAEAPKSRQISSVWLSAGISLTP